jgi:hypothetical protein
MHQLFSQDKVVHTYLSNLNQIAKKAIRLQNQIIIYKYYGQTHTHIYIYIQRKWKLWIVE